MRTIIKITKVFPSTLIIVIGICLFLLSCSRATTINESESWKYTHSVNLREMVRIGSDELDQDDYFFSTINDIRIDNSDNIYVLDRKEFRIQKYSAEGKYQRSFVFKKGQGPGEFQNILLFDVGPSFNIVMIDDVLGRIATFSEDGKFVEAITTRIKPAGITVGNDGSVFVCGGPRDIEKKIIYKYLLPHDVPTSIFCESNRAAQRISTVGIGGALCKDLAGNILYSFAIPYEIREYSPNGRLISQFARTHSFGKIHENEYGLPRADVFVQDICSFPDGKILNVLLDRRNKPFIYIFDLFDQSGEWLLSFDTTRYLKDWYGRIVRIDSKGFLYIESLRPFPHIRKYKIEFIPIDK